MSNLAFGGKLFHGAPDSGGTSLMPGIEVPPNTGCRFDVPAADISEALSQDGPTHGDAFQSKCGDFVRNAFIKLIEAMTDGAQQQPGDANGYPILASGLDGTTSRTRRCGGNGSSVPGTAGCA
jgi:hypothetical protein